MTVNHERVNPEPVYYQLRSGDNTALSAPEGNPGGNLVNATPDQTLTDGHQLWELLVDLTSFEGDFLRVVMRNKRTGFVAVAPPGSNTSGVGQQVFDPDDDWSSGQMWTFVHSGDGWAIRPANREDQNLNAMGDAKIGSLIGIWSWGGGQPVEVWSAQRAKH